MRKAELARKTNESEITVKLSLDEKGYKINTGFKFFDHMLEQLAHHGGFGLELEAKSLDEDLHHIVEDTAITLGEAFFKALGDKKGIKRYSNAIIAMDEALSLCAIDISSRPFCNFEVEIKEEKVSDFETVLTKHFFNSFANSAKITLHIKLLNGEDTHHIIEAIFKSFAHALKDAVQIVSDEIPSTKGIL